MAAPHELSREMEPCLLLLRTVSRDGDFVLLVTDPSGEATEKIRALGYIGVLAYGAHHQRHHWMMVQGESPHSH